MTNSFVPGVGGILSADIAVPDHAREMGFYSRVLGTGDAPLWGEDLMNNQGIPVIGLGSRSAEYSDLPLQWMPHIQVADVAAVVERALDQGGRELMHGKDDKGTSEWAVLRDPYGAAFGVIPVVSREAILPAEGLSWGAAAEPVGCISWLELAVVDASATSDFYRQVIGWKVQEVEMEHAGQRYSNYDMCGEDGVPVARICHARGLNLGLPPVWMIYLLVGDFAESLRRVGEGGGKIIKSVRGGEGIYEYAVIQDPVGAYLALRG